MLYGGVVGSMITLSISIWLFVKLDILTVLEDLFGLRMRKQKGNQDNADFQMWYNQENTSGSIRLKKLMTTNKNKVEQTSQAEEAYVQTELLGEDDDQTELLDETILLENETELISDHNESFVVIEDVVIVHDGLKQKEGSK